MIHKALKSTDAEITLDLEKGQAIFDYSLNKYGSSLDSNSSCCLSEDGSIKARFLKLLYPWPQIIFSALSSFISVGYMFFANIYPKYQYGWQKYLKSRNDIMYGIGEEAIIGKQESKKLKFNLDNNIWFEYKLDGDYNSKIKKISLNRRFIKKEYLGITSHKQKGWLLTFEFKEAPEHGYVMVRYTL